MATIKLDCPSCNGPRNCDVIALHVEDYGVLDATGQFRIVKCRGCDRVFFEYDDVMNSKGEPTLMTLNIWPPLTVRQRPKWLYEVYNYDHSLSSLMGSVYVALDNKLSVLAAIGCRTTFDRATHVLGASPELTFVSKLKWLSDKGWIGVSEKEFLEILTDAGNAAAHRGWEPTEEQLSFMLDILEAFVHRIVVVRPAADQMRAAIPARKPKL